MKRKELFAVITIFLGEAPDLKELLQSGSNMQEYVDELVSEMKISIPGIDEDIEICKVKAMVKSFEDES